MPEPLCKLNFVKSNFNLSKKQNLSFQRKTSFSPFNEDLSYLSMILFFIFSFSPLIDYFLSYSNDCAFLSVKMFFLAFQWKCSFLPCSENFLSYLFNDLFVPFKEIFFLASIWKSFFVPFFTFPMQFNFFFTFQWNFSLHVHLNENVIRHLSYNKLGPHTTKEENEIKPYISTIQ